MRKKSSSNCKQNRLSNLYKKNMIRANKCMIIVAVFLAVTIFVILFDAKQNVSLPANAEAQTSEESTAPEEPQPTASIISKPDINNVQYNKQEDEIVITSDADVPKEELEQELIKTGYVTAVSGLNIREDADIESKKVGAYSYQQEVQITEKKDGWLLTDLGYINEDYISQDQPEEMIFSTFSTRSRNLVDLGSFKTTAYCSCKKCCGNTKGITRTGTHVTEGRTIAVDPKVIPLGTHVVIDGNEYIAEDTGSAVKGNVIDVYIDGHQKALKYGVKYKEVYAYK